MFSPYNPESMQDTWAVLAIVDEFLRERKNPAGGIFSSSPVEVSKVFYGQFRGIGIKFDQLIEEKEEEQRTEMRRILQTQVHSAAVKTGVRLILKKKFWVFAPQNV